MKSQAEYLPQRAQARADNRSYLLRTIAAMLFLSAGTLLSLAFTNLLKSTLPEGSPAFALATIAITLASGYLSYALYVELIERRTPDELTFDGAAAELGGGILLGGGLFALIMGLLWLPGIYQVDGTNSWLVIFPALAGNVPAGFLQEILFRGIIFRLTEEAFGTLWAMLISAALFAAIHFVTRQANIIGTFSFAASAGVLLAAAYLLTRRLWLSIGLHIAWDVTSDGIFGVGFSESTSQPTQGLLNGSLNGPALLTGGAGGVENALLTALVITAACFILIRITMELGRWRKRSRRRGGSL